MTAPKPPRYITERSPYHAHYPGLCRRKVLTGGVIGLCETPEHYSDAPKPEPRIVAEPYINCAPSLGIHEGCNCNDQDKPRIVAECEVCGRTGKAAKVCAFQVCCSCWRGIPCSDVRPVARKGK